VLAIEPQFLGRRAHRVEKRGDAGKSIRRMADKAVVANVIHRDATSATGAVQQLAEALIGALDLFVEIASDEPIKDLAQRQWQLLGVSDEHRSNLSSKASDFADGRQSINPRGRANRATA
jgi:hypothetical protein